MNTAIMLKAEISGTREVRLVLQGEDGSIGLARVNPAQLRALEAPDGNAGELTVEALWPAERVARLAAIALAGPANPSERREATDPLALAMLGAAVALMERKIERLEAAAGAPRETAP